MTGFPRSVTILLVVAIVLGCILRVSGIGFGLPFLYHPDEPNKIEMAQHIFKTGDLNPHYFLKPSLFIYLNALVYIPYYLLGKLTGVFQSRADLMTPTMLAMGVGRTPMPTTVLLGRLLTMLFGASSIILVYLIGSHPGKNHWRGLIAALMMAISPTNVANSRYITPDAFVTFFILLTVWAALRIYQRGKLRDYVLAGVAAGLTLSCKYNGGAVLLVIPLAHFLRPSRDGLRDAKLYLAILLCPAIFLVTSPFALLDYQTFLRDMLFEARHYSSAGHPGMEGNTLNWYVSYLLQNEGPVFVLAIGGMLYGLYLRSREILIISVFPVVYFAFVSLMTVRNDRTLLPVIPFLFVLASYLLLELFEHLHSVQWKPRRILSGVALSIALAFCLAVPLERTAEATDRLTTIDSRETARIWIATNIPSGSKIAIESYAPFVDPSDFQVQGFTSIIDHAPDWYLANGFHYLVFSQGMFGRFYAEPDLYASQVSQYDSFFDRFQLVKGFMDGGYDIRIYRVAEK